MKLKLDLAVIILCMLLAAAVAHAGNEKVVYTTNGEKFTGTITKQDENFITIRIKGGTATIPVSIVDRIVDFIDEASLQLLVVHDKKLADRLHDELAYGTAFTKLVWKHSKHLSLFRDGMTDFVDRSYLPEKVSKIAFDLRKDGYTMPIEVDKAFYIVKLLDKRKTEKVTPGSQDTQEPEEPAPAEPPEEPEKESPVRIAVLPVAETTHEARVAATGADLQELLVSEIVGTTGLEPFLTDKASKPDDENAPDFIISGEVAKSGAAYAVQFVLKDKTGKELFTTDRLTAVCPADKMDDLFNSIKQLAESLIREIQKSR